MGELRGKTSLLHPQQRLGAPFKPGFGLSVIPQHRRSFSHPGRSAADWGTCRFSSQSYADLPRHLDNHTAQVREWLGRIYCDSHACVLGTSGTEAITNKAAAATFAEGNKGSKER
jgi:hypothetical protein